MKVSFAHTNIVAKDRRRLARFYIDVFDCRPKPPERDLAGDWLDRLTGIDNVQIQGMHLEMPGAVEGGPTLEILQYNTASTQPERRIDTSGFGHIAFLVDDVDRCPRMVIDNGGSTVGETVRGTVENVGPIHLVYAKDPEGNIIEIQKWE